MRVTELPNPLTNQLDSLDLVDQIDGLMKAEQEMFGPHQWGESILTASHIRKLVLTQSTFQKVKAAKGQIVLAGAGTSGRIAFFLADLWRNEYGIQVDGLMAGGREAFFRAMEGKEDQAQQGATDLISLDLRPGPKIFVGISCGLSAAYVMGAAKAAIESNFDHIYILGFNPIHSATDREDPFLNGSIRTFLDHKKLTVINPILGPEPIAGSTRMKGGTATLLILQAVFQSKDLANFLLKMRGLHLQQCVLNQQFLPKILPELDRDGFQYEPELNLSFMSVLDASECAPTFGCAFDHISAILTPTFFEKHAWLKSAFQQDKWSSKSQKIPISLRQIASQESTFEMAMCTKWLTNMISTLYFVRMGKVFGNRMIDLRISNIKLWFRARDLIAELAQVTPEEAEHAIQSVIEEEAQGRLEVSDWVRLASQKNHVVPTALLMGLANMDREEAEHLLQKKPKVSDALIAAKEKV